jgi:hypothetical protein
MIAINIFRDLEYGRVGFFSLFGCLFPLLGLCQSPSAPEILISLFLCRKVKEQLEIKDAMEINHSYHLN